MTRHRSGPRRSLAVGGAIVIAAFLAAAMARAAEPLAAENAWVPLAPPVAKVHAGYMTIVNRGDTDQHIVAAESPHYAHVELHESFVKDGLSGMRPIDQVTVPAQGRVAFEPAGLHFMLIGPKQRQALDGHVRIVLRLRSGEQLGVSAVVRRHGSPGGHHHHTGSP